MRLMRRRSVVLPLPLRPSNKSVSPTETDKVTPERMTPGFFGDWPALPLTRYVTSLNRMVACDAGVFAFICVDMSGSGRDHHTAVPHFCRI